MCWRATCNVQRVLFLKGRSLLGGDRDVAGVLRCWWGVMVLDFALFFMDAPFFEPRMDTNVHEWGSGLWGMSPIDRSRVLHTFG